MSARSVRGWDLLPDDAEVFCYTFPDQFHTLGEKKDVKAADVVERPGENVRRMVRCDRHQAYVMWAVKGSGIAAPLEPEESL